MRIALALAVVAAGCSESGPTPAAPAAPPPTTAVPAAAPSPPPTAAPATPAASPDAPLALDPPGGRLLAQTRGRARHAVGRSGVLVAMPDLPPPAGEPAECRRRGAVQALTFPLGATSPREVVDPAMQECDGVSLDPIEFVPLGDDPAVVDCAFPHNLAWACTVTDAFGGTPSRTFGFPETQNTAATGAAFASRPDRTILAAVTTTMAHLVGFVVPPTGAAKRGLLASGIPEQAMTVRVEPRDDGTAIVTWMPPSAGPARRVTMTAEATQAAPPERVDRPVELSAGLRLEVQRERRADPHVAAGPPDGPLAPVGGLDPATATFGPALAALGPDRALLAWSEGLERATRIRVARFDPKTRAITGPILDVSTAGREAGWVQLAAHADRAVVLWNEKGESGWEIRLAEVR